MIMITKGKMLDLITHCLNYMSLFFLEMYGDLSGEFLCRYCLKGRNVECFFCDGAGKPKITFRSIMKLHFESRPVTKGIDRLILQKFLVFEEALIEVSAF